MKKFNEFHSLNESRDINKQHQKLYNDITKVISSYDDERQILFILSLGNLTLDEIDYYNKLDVISLDHDNIDMKEMLNIEKSARPYAKKLAELSQYHVVDIAQTIKKLTMDFNLYMTRNRQVKKSLKFLIGTLEDIILKEESPMIPNEVEDIAKIFHKIYNKYYMQRDELAFEFLFLAFREAFTDANLHKEMEKFYKDVYQHKYNESLYAKFALKAGEKIAKLCKWDADLISNVGVQIIEGYRILDVYKNAARFGESERDLFSLYVFMNE